MLRTALLMILITLLIGPVQAEPDNDTVIALAEAVIPPRDRIDLARRLLGVTEVAPPPTTSPQWQLGDVQSFWVTNEFEDTAFQVQASLRTMGDHIYFWVEEGYEIDPSTLEELAAMFDRDIYEPMRGLFGSEDSPGIDGDTRVYALFAAGQGPYVAAYFASEHIYPVAAVSTSNEHEMFFFNLDTLGTNFDAEAIAGIVAHEFQHMIQEAQDTNESIWLNEGFSKFAEVYTGYRFGTAGAALSFLARPQTQLNTWPEYESTAPHYGAGLLFVSYFHDRFGVDAVQALAQHPASGLKSVDDVLAQLGGPDASTFFADWVLANFIQNPTLAEGQYGYRSLPALGSPALTDQVMAYPYQATGSSNQYATDYYILTPQTESLAVQLKLPHTVRLVDTAATSGQRMWYSNKEDNSDTTLTQRFDLRDVSSATLNFNVWYHIENLWDYGYVMVSTDEGATWTILDTPHKTLENPHNNAYGPGYTGFSDGWISESVSLDPYTGQEVLLRFEMITDDATTQPGMLIDDVSIPEIGYASDFEIDGGGWQAQGWVLTDNTLPQQVWVQAIQFVGSDVEVTRWQATGDAAWTLDLNPGTDQVVLAISPFAPLTTVPMTYELVVTAS